MPTTDPYAVTIGTVMANLGYQVVLATEPKYRDYDLQMPTVFVSPVKDRIVTWLAFNTVSVSSVYEVVYIVPNELDTQLTTQTVWDFKTSLITEFQGVNTAMATTIPRPWNVIVEDVQAYNRALAKKGYTYSAMRVIVNWIEK